jgi:hypothetical protein
MSLWTTNAGPICSISAGSLWAPCSQTRRWQSMLVSLAPVVGAVVVSKEQIISGITSIITGYLLASNTKVLCSVTDTYPKDPSKPQEHRYDSCSR